MWNVYLYWSCLVLCSIYALARGGAPERLATAIMLGGSALTALLALTAWHSFTHFEGVVFLIDLLDQVLLFLIAARADRFWPIAVAGLHLLSPTTHLMKALVSFIDPLAYYSMQAIGSYGILILIAVGTARHRQRVKLFGTDNSWSSSLR